MIYLGFSVFLMLLVLNVGRYSVEVGRYRSKFAEVEADAQRLSNTLSLISIERDSLKEKYVLLESKLVLLERDYKYAVEADPIIKDLTVFFESHYSYATVDDWVSGSRPVFAKFLNYVENLESSVNSRLN